MRSDLTPAFIAAKNAPFRRPRQWLIFKFPTAGNVYISDQPLGAADGLSHEFQPLVVSWGDLIDTVGDVQATESGEIRQMSISLWNGGETPFSNYFLYEHPENVEVELYQWFVGLAESDAALMDRFVVADPIKFDEASRLLDLDIVSLSIRFDQPCGDLLTKEAYPYAADSDIGKGIPQAFGSTGQIPGLVAKTAMQLSLKGSILKSTMTLQVYEDLDELLFPTSGAVQIEEEKIRYNGRTSSSLSVIQRGYLSEAVTHLDKRQINQIITDHTIFLCKGPVAAINNVMIEGFPAPAGIYTVRPDLNPARIIFTEKPWVKKFAEGSRFLEMQFDGTASGNTALQAPYAFDPAEAATAARILPGNNILAIIQNTVNSHRGEILKAYLAVEHWESGNFQSDYVEVWVSGVGVVGRLSRPNPADDIVLDADVDIDHGHQHEISGEHEHEFTEPTVTTSEPTGGHDHPTSATRGETKNGTPADFNQGVGSYGGGMNDYDETEVWFMDLAKSASGGVITLNMSTVISGTAQVNAIEFVPEWGDTITLDNIPPEGINGAITINAGAWDTNYTDQHYWLKVRSWTYANNGSVLVYVSNPVINYNAIVGSVQGENAGVTAAASNSRVIAKSTTLQGVGIKDANDVKPLATDNQGLNITKQENPSRTIVNLFDLTSQVNFDWGWFTGREIRVTYFDTGVGEGKTVHILHCFFDVEYVPAEIVFSNKVTAEVTATISRPDLAVQHLLTDRAEVPESDFDADSFAAIAGKYTTLGYRLDGLIDPTLIVRDAIKKICFQAHSRFIPSGGKLKMVLREGHPDSKPAAKTLTSDEDLVERSISVSRQPLKDISNKVQLFFKRDWTVSDTDTTGYLDSVTREDTKSIALFGLKVRKDAFNFDLIRDPGMAGAVADFYLMTSAFPSSFYTFLACLDQFELEKEDVLQVSANFNKMSKVPMIVRAMDRLFGSLNSSSPNLMRIVAENLYYILIELAHADQVLVMDALSTMTEYSDAVHVLDQLFSQLDLSREDEAKIGESLLILVDWHKVNTDTVTLDDLLLGVMQCLRTDTAVMMDDIEFYSSYGYGSGGYGQIPYGGKTAYKQKNPDQIYIFEQLFNLLSALRNDAIQVSETCLFSSGYGGKLSSGYGLTPYGM
jgi:hypothetical protein